MDAQARQQIADKLKTANNVLVTVSTNPSVDQLASALGFTLLLNKMGKHGTAVFSGEVPSTIEFLKPEATIEKNTDSLRDFIVSLDKSKADRLRYKVEDKVVKIFITPYHTSLSEKDLEFSQGDFNVDAVVALGVREQKELDSAITAHGRILHDAVVITINNREQGNLGTLNWNEPKASSLSELVVSLSEVLGPNLFDAQIATALLTGIVSETNRFSNDRTTPTTMTYAARLMSAGANQQLIATNLKEPEPIPVAPPTPPKNIPPKPVVPEVKPVSNGTIQIDHEANKLQPAPAPKEENVEGQIDIDPQGTLHRLDLEKKHRDTENRMITEPPTLKSKLTANTEPEALDPSSDPLSSPTSNSPILTHSPAAAQPFTPLPPPDPLRAGQRTLSEIEKVVDSSHTHSSSESPTPIADAARSAVSDAFQGPQAVPPIQPVHTQPNNLAVGPTPASNGLNLPTNLVPTTPQTPLSTTSSNGPATPPPPVPPPMAPPRFGQPPSDEDVPPVEPLAAL